MKQYKLETLIYYSNPLKFDKMHVVKNSGADIQEKLDAYAKNGWRLVSTDTSDFGLALYFYLYFEKDA